MRLWKKQNACFQTLNVSYVICRMHLERRVTVHRWSKERGYMTLGKKQYSFKTKLRHSLNITVEALTLWFPIQSISSWRSKCVAVTGMPTSETTLCSSENIPSMRCTDSGTVTASPSGSSSTPCSKPGLRWGSREGSIPASNVPWRLGGYSPIPGSRPSKFIMSAAKLTFRREIMLWISNPITSKPVCSISLHKLNKQQA